MSNKEWIPEPSDALPCAVNDLSRNSQRPWHRLSTVRRQQEMTQINVARRLDIDIAVVRQQEDETFDLPLSVLYEWQRVLEVPIADLLVESNEPLSPPVMEWSRLVKVMKTVAAVTEKANTPALKRLLLMLRTQLLEIMPQMTDVSPWPVVGQRRSPEEYGRTVERQMHDNMLSRRPH